MDLRVPQVGMTARRSGSCLRQHPFLRAVWKYRGSSAYHSGGGGRWRSGALAEDVTAWAPGRTFCSQGNCLSQRASGPALRDPGQVSKAFPPESSCLDPALLTGRLPAQVDPLQIQIRQPPHSFRLTAE